VRSGPTDQAFLSRDLRPTAEAEGFQIHSPIWGVAQPEGVRPMLLHVTPATLFAGRARRW